MSNIRVTVWNEYRHEQENDFIRGIYPDGIHGAIAEGLREHGFDHVRTATLDEPEHGLTEEVLAETDVLTWWGHKAHGLVSEEIVARVQARVLQGMGLIVLHSGHASKIFQKLMGTTCMLHWREADERERFWVVAPGHPIAQGLGPYFELPEVEMYGEFFDIPYLDSVLPTGFISHESWMELCEGQCLPQWLLFQPRQRQDLLLPPRPRDLPDLLRCQRAQSHRQRRTLGGPCRWS